MQKTELAAFFNLLKSSYEALGFYPEGNPAVDQKIENFLKVYGRFLDSEGHLYLGFENGLISLNGEILPHDTQQLPATKWLYKTCVDRKVYSITIDQGIDKKDVGKFLKVMRQDPNVFPSPDAASKLLFRQMVQRIQINPVPSDQTFSSLNMPPGLRNGSSPSQTGAYVEPDPNIIHHNQTPENTQYRGGDFRDTQTGLGRVNQVNPWETNKPQQHMSGGLAPSRRGHSEIDLERDRPEFISEREFHQLQATMIDFIRQQKLKKVAAALSMMRKDLTSDQRSDRELAFSSYQVVVRSLIKERQDKPLNSVLRSLLTDLQAIKEEDLYQIHSDTLGYILEYFWESGDLKPFVFGIDILANQNLRQTPTIQKMVDAQLNEYLSLHTMETLFALDGELKEAVDHMYRKHGVGLVKPTLRALYDSENRNVRKVALEYLTTMGPIIFPLLINDLKECLMKDEAWYVARNLLTLLSKNPPVELVDLLDDLLTHEQRQIRDLTARCVFFINHPNAVERGNALIHKAKKDQLGKLLGYLSISKEPAFGDALVDRFDDDTLSDRKKVDIIDTIGKLDSPTTVDFLDSLLAKSSVFGKRQPSEIRIAAARALSQSKHAPALGALTKYQRDKQPEVRDMVAKALGR
jgi:hypothetical protein